MPTDRNQPSTIVRRGERPILSNGLLRGRDGVELEALSLLIR
ncbi:hypothetical protein [Azospirillum thiophilum]|nr:hypothetical protein [Azospirillum thiophilum]